MSFDETALHRVITSGNVCAMVIVVIRDGKLERWLCGGSRLGSVRGLKFHFSSHANDRDVGVL